MTMIYSEEWARSSSFSRTEVVAEIQRHDQDPQDFFRDMYGNSGKNPDTIPGSDVLDWLGY